MAVPAMLIAYGVSLRLGPRPGAGEPAGQIATIVTLKLLVQPLVAYAGRRLRSSTCTASTCSRSR